MKIFPKEGSGGLDALAAAAVRGAETRSGRHSNQEQMEPVMTHSWENNTPTTPRWGVAPSSLDLPP